MENYLTPNAGMHEADKVFTSPPALSSFLPVDCCPGSSYDDGLKREAEGLFAGVTLLNEMEPLEDDDELSACPSHMLDSKANSVVEHFVGQLRPAFSGEGIGCSWNESASIFRCEGRFSCTTRDIQAHFWECKLSRNAQAKESIHDALKVFLEQPETKVRLAKLQQQCEVIQEGLRSIPNVEEFLHHLEYTPSGNLKCQRPACAVSCEFEASASKIRDHFHVYHCASFEGALRYGTSKLISANLNLQLIQPEMPSKLDKILEDGHIRSAIAKRISDFTNPRTRTFSENDTPSAGESLETKKPSWEQLRVLRTLRAKFVVHHRQFLQRTATSSSSEVQDLRQACRRYADLLDTGLLTLKAIMNGESPSSLREVFAFISLSYAMAGAMQVKGKSISFCIDRPESQRWRDSLRSAIDRHTYDELVSLLWPELNKYQEDAYEKASEEVSNLLPGWATPYPSSLDLFQRPSYLESYLNSSTMYDWLDFLNKDSSSSHLHPSPLHSTAERLLQESLSDESFRFSDWLDFPDTDGSTFQNGNLDVVGSPRDISRRRSPEMRPPSRPNSHRGNTSSPCEAQYTDLETDKTNLEELQGLAYTVIFMRAISFLIFIGGMGLLLVHLSGSNQHCFSTDKSNFTTTNIARFSRFLEVVKFRILNRLCLDNSLSKFHPLFRVAIKVLEAGWLRTVRDVERYLISTAKLFAHSRKSYLCVVAKVLALSLDASSDQRIDHDYLYRDNHQQADNYSPNYVAKRQEEEAEAFAENSMSFEVDKMEIAGESDLRPSIEQEDYYGTESSLRSSSLRRRSSETRSKSQNDSHAYSSADVSAASIELKSASQELDSRKCDIEGCSNVYTGRDSANSLARHKREKHSNRSSFTCPVQGCCRASNRLHNLRAHWDTKHKGIAMPEYLAATPSRGGGGMKRKRE